MYTRIANVVCREEDLRLQLIKAFFFAAATAVCAQISFRLWFTPVPITLQVLAVILSGLVLGSRWGAVSQLQYLAMGAIGLPVFSNFTGGIVAFFGPTGGYLFGFVLGAFLAGLVFERLGQRTSLAAWIAGIAGVAGIYLFGAWWLGVWFVFLMGQTPAIAIKNAWALGVMPFIGIDLIKTALASFAAVMTRRF